VNAEAKLLSVAQGREDFHRGFLALQEEHAYEVKQFRGVIPPDLEGTLFRNGPGSMNAGSEAYGHWFDGPGMVSAITFQSGKVHFRNRYVRTPKFVSDQRQGHITQRGFGTQIKGGPLRNLFRPISNPANTGVSWHGGKLCAFYEGGQPFRLCPSTLETLGPELYDGLLNSRKTLSAHGKIHGKTGRQINFGVNLAGIGLSGIRCALDVHDLPSRGGPVKSCRVPLPYFPFIHDFALSENYGLFLVSSIRFGLSGPLMGLRTLSESMSFDGNKPVRGLLIDLRTMSLAKEFELPPALVVHFGNAFERDQEFIVDFFQSDNSEGFDWLCDVFNVEQVTGAGLVRLRLNTKTGRALLSPHHNGLIGEFPAWNPRQTGKRTDRCYFVAHSQPDNKGFFNTVVCLDTETGNIKSGNVGEHCHTSEALFAPRRGASDPHSGYLLAVVYNALHHRSEIQIRDAENPAIEVGAAVLNHHVPFGFHGHFTTDLFGAIH